MKWITFVAVRGAIFSFPVLIVGLFNFLHQTENPMNEQNLSIFSAEVFTVKKLNKDQPNPSMSKMLAPR